MTERKRTHRVDLGQAMTSGSLDAEAFRAEAAKQQKAKMFRHRTESLKAFQSIVDIAVARIEDGVRVGRKGGGGRR